jgi:hypothetical protein
MALAAAANLARLIARQHQHKFSQAIIGHQLKLLSPSLRDTQYG